MMTSSKIQKMILNRMPKKPLREADAATVVVAMRPEFYGKGSACANSHGLAPRFTVPSLSLSGSCKIGNLGCWGNHPFAYNENENHFHLGRFGSQANIYAAKTD